MAAGAEIPLSQFAGWVQQIGVQARTIDYGPALKKCALHVIASTKRNFDGGHAPDGAAWKPLGRPRPRGGSKVLRDTGALMASIAARGQGHLETYDATSLTIGTNLIYAGVHQRGATITPRRAKALSIPLTKDAARLRSPRDFKGTLVFEPTRSGGNVIGFLVEHKEKGKGAKKKIVKTQHFVLVRSVTIPGRPFLGFNKELIDKCDETVALHVVQKLRGR